VKTITRFLPNRFIALLLFFLASSIILLSLSFLCLDNNNITVRAQQQQQQQQTSQGSPLPLIPGITGNILAVVSFLIGTSSFILGLRIQSAAKIPTTSTSSSTTTLPSSLMNKYFELLILALVIPSVVINIFGILVVASHLYPEDFPYLLILYALFIPAGAVLFLVGKLRILSLKK
jgi:hypothetical protein